MPIEKMPVASPVATGVVVTRHVRPWSAVCRTRDAVVAIQMWPSLRATTLVPLAANAPSLGRAGGRRSAGTRVQEAPPSLVVRMTNWPRTASLNATPCAASLKARASRNIAASAAV